MKRSSQKLVRFEEPIMPVYAVNCYFDSEINFTLKFDFLQTKSGMND